MNIKEIFTAAVKKGASDVHLVVNLPPNLRIDGQLEAIDKTPINGKEMEKMVMGMLSAEQQKTFLAKKDLDFGYQDESGNRFRVNVYFEKNNIGLVARLISEKIPSMEDLNLPEVIIRLLNQKQGLILVTGPTGCGKSTTLAAMIDYLNTNFAYNIITFEDPIEYVFKPKKSMIVQRQLGGDMTSFAEGLKHALRQDPNVIMVGEMRDLETIATTITLAETGHLVLGTLHTYSAAQTVDRIIDSFPPHQQNQVKSQLSTTLAGIVSQRLIPKVGGGRVAAREILLNTPAVANMIRENKVPQIKTILETGAREGMVSMQQDLKRLLKDKLITKEDFEKQSLAS